MKLGTFQKAERAALLFWTLAFAAACDSNAAAKPTLIPSLVELKPAILCIDAALDRDDALECLASKGIARDYRYPDQPKSTEDFTRQLLVMWASLGQGGAERLSSQHFDSAVDYATCVERAANALQGLKGKPKEAIGAGKARTEQACAGEALSVHSVARRNPGILNGDIRDLPQGEAKTYLLARIFAGMTYRYIIEANGWVVDEMRPCVRYLDGRPPSVGCAGEPQLRVPSPPPSYPPK